MQTGTGDATRVSVLAVLALVSAANQLDRLLMNILLEPVRLEFALTDIELGLLSGLAFVLIYTILSIPASIWVVRHSRRNLVAAAAALWGVMTMLCGMAQSFAQLLAARIGVGIGEAGGIAPSHAMLSDLYPPGERATAMAVFAAGANVGALLAFIVGGFIGQSFGWRAPFIVAGAATVALALILRLVVTEPVRAAAAGHLPGDRPHLLIGATARAMWLDPALRQMWIGATLLSVIAYAELAFVPSVLMRSHGMTIAATGAYLAIVAGLGALASFLVGRLSDLLGRRDVRWSLWIVAAIVPVAKALAIGFCLAADTVTALALLLLPGAMIGIFLGPSVAVLHDRIAPVQRPIASALFVLVLNLVGLGLGPVLAGAISQFVFAGFGEHSLRYAMAAMQAVGLWGALHYGLAGRHLGGALARPRAA